jgi:hypothetical protein
MRALTCSNSMKWHLRGAVETRYQCFHGVGAGPVWFLGGKSRRRFWIFGVWSRQCGSLDVTSEAAERVASSDDDVDRESSSLEGISVAAERGTSSEFLDEGTGPSEIGEPFVSVTSIVAECGTIGGLNN